MCDRNERDALMTADGKILAITPVASFGGQN
jgi:hypothetical protein